jgi:hypothetical protein
MPIPIIQIDDKEKIKKRKKEDIQKMKLLYKYGNDGETPENFVEEDSEEEYDDNYDNEEEAEELPDLSTVNVNSTAVKTSLKSVVSVPRSSSPELIPSFLLPSTSTSTPSQSASTPVSSTSTSTPSSQDFLNLFVSPSSTTSSSSTSSSVLTSPTSVFSTSASVPVSSNLLPQLTQLFGGSTTNTSPSSSPITPPQTVYSKNNIIISLECMYPNYKPSELPISSADPVPFSFIAVVSCKFSFINYGDEGRYLYLLLLVHIFV